MILVFYCPKQDKILEMFTEWNYPIAKLYSIKRNDYQCIWVDYNEATPERIEDRFGFVFLGYLDY